MTLREKIGKLFFIGLPSAILDDQSKRVLETIQPGAIILFAVNIETPEQVKKYTDDINSFLGYKPVFAVDQEGGIVTRFRNHFTVAPGAMAVAATGDVHNAFLTGSILAAEMSACGIQWDLAPVVDINVNPKNPGIGVRSYGDTAEQVVLYANAFIDGLHSRGVLSCIKHFPGLGRVVVDPHHDQPVLTISKESLLATEIRPYRTLDADAIMPSHAFYSALQTVKEPASLSKEVLVNFARNELGFSGIFVADDLSMGGVAKYFTPIQAAIKAVESGMDFLSFCHDPNVQTTVFNSLCEHISQSSDLQSCIDVSYKRVNTFMKKACQSSTSDFSAIASPAHTQTMQRIIDAGITIVSKKENSILLDNVQAIFSVILSRKVQVEEGHEDNGVPFAALELASYVKKPLHTFTTDITEAYAQELLAQVPAYGRIIVFSEDAHLHPSQHRFIQSVAEKNDDVLVIALRNPFDIYIQKVNLFVLTYGYEAVSQKALLRVLKGESSAGGKVPLKHYEACDVLVEYIDGTISD